MQRRAPTCMTCFAGSHRCRTSSYARSTFGASNSTATTASTSSYSISASSSTNTGSLLNTVAPAASATSSGTGFRGFSKTSSANFTGTNFQPSGGSALRLSNGRLPPGTRTHRHWCRVWRPTYASAARVARIILDTKFYAQALKVGAYGTARLPSANLYQLFTYLRQQSCEPGWEQAEGVLLYPRTTRDFAVEFTTHGHRIRALSLDLAQTWQEIHVALMQIVATDPAISSMPHSV